MKRLCNCTVDTWCGAKRQLKGFQLLRSIAGQWLQVCSEVYGLVLSRRQTLYTVDGNKYHEYIMSAANATWSLSFRLDVAFTATSKFMRQERDLAFMIRSYSQHVTQHGKLIRQPRFWNTRASDTYTSIHAGMYAKPGQNKIFRYVFSREDKQQENSWRNRTDPGTRPGKPSKQLAKQTQARSDGWCDRSVELGRCAGGTKY